MNTDPNNPPMEWFNRRGEAVRVPGSPDPGLFINLEYSGNEETPASQRMMQWHFHHPTGFQAHWTGRGLWNHTIVSLDPLHLEPSLGCDEGCTFHCFIRDGKYVQA